MEEAVLNGLAHLNNLLRRVDDIECTEFSGNEKTAKLQELRSNIHDAYAGILEALKVEVAKLVPTTGLTWKQARAELSKQTQQASWRHAKGSKANDKYAVALSDFLTAIHLYLKRHGKTQGLA